MSEQFSFSTPLVNERMSLSASPIFAMTSDEEFFLGHNKMKLQKNLLKFLVLSNFILILKTCQELTSADINSVKVPSF